MEILKSPMIIQTRISQAVIFSSSIKCPQHMSFPIYSVRSVPSRKFRISAHLGRGRTRPNHLRGKIAHQFQRSHRGKSLETPVSDAAGIAISGLTPNDYAKTIQNVNESSGFDDTSGRSDPNEEPGKKKVRESVLWNKLEGWVEQYKKDTEIWGIGTGPIFTIYENSESKIERVVVNEDEIRRRSCGTEDMDEVSFKISLANDMAIEMKNNMNLIPKNSSVAKFVVSGEESQISNYKSHFTGMVQSISSKPGFFRKTSVAVALVLCGIFVFRATQVLYTKMQSSRKLTKLEKEMLRRKQRSRNVEENKARGAVEVMMDSVEPKSMPFRRPSLDKEELAMILNQARVSITELSGMEQASHKNNDLKDKIEEIRMMARHAREVERRDSCQGDTDKKGNRALKDVSKNSEEQEKNHVKAPYSPKEVFRANSHGEKHKIESEESLEVTQNFDALGCHSAQKEGIARKKVRFMNSVDEAREYLSKKNGNMKVFKGHQTSIHAQNDFSNSNDPVLASRSTNMMSFGGVPVSLDFDGKHEPLHPLGDQSMVGKSEDGNVDGLHDCEISKQALVFSSPEAKISDKDAKFSKVEISLPEAEDIMSDLKDNENKVLLSPSMRDTIVPRTLGSENKEDFTKKDLEAMSAAMPEMGVSSQNNSRDWIEKNFHELEPVIEKIGFGFTENYQMAREKLSQEQASEMERSSGYEDELEWMADEKLRDIVFQVRDNELSGKDPFHQMTVEQKSAFFSGLGRKAEAENKKLLHLHEYLHSNIENLDYGADGISLYDPVEKILPRWKVPPVERIAKLKILKDQVNDLSLETSKTSEKIGDIPQKTSQVSPFKTNQKKTGPKTVIQGSDGSVKAGKKSGKEFWQHTKKWSQGFIECYNAESDPEIKAVMKDIGKDLDRWTTEQDIKEAAELWEKLPEKGRQFVKQRLDKVKRQMELFGPQAVVSKYREYAEEKEEDHLWWLDLPYVLCIELYTVEDGEDKVGLYSLEMAADLELDPKQYHVIAFENAGDCKNLCYIIQAHMEMLGNGHAFVIARPPKDAFREAKANGFSVTVVRKGEVQMDVDNTLEEVEESLVEIGSKIYHDKVTKERSVDINALMKGVFGFNLPAQRRRAKKKLQRRIKK